MAKRKIGLICSLTYYEMKLVVAVFSRIILDNELKGAYTKKRIHDLIYKFIDMLTKQKHLKCQRIKMISKHLKDIKKLLKAYHKKFDCFGKPIKKETKKRKKRKNGSR